MTPKTPKELREEIETENERPSKAGHERTAEGVETPTPSRETFFDNLEKAAEPEK